MKTNQEHRLVGPFPRRISGPESQLTPAFYGLQAIRRPNLAQHPANVVLNCLLCEIERSSYFLVREAFAEQLHQLLLSSGETEILADLNSWTPSFRTRYMIEKGSTQCRWTYRLSIGYGPNRARHIRR